MIRQGPEIRTWADWNDTVPGFVEIDLVGHEGGNPAGEFVSTLTVTDGDRHGHRLDREPRGPQQGPEKGSSPR